jgi:hypothetical protein
VKRTQNHIGLGSSFYQELSIVEITFDSVDVWVKFLQLCGRRMFSYKCGNSKLWVSFGDGVEKIPTDVASCTGPVAS